MAAHGLPTEVDDASESAQAGGRVWSGRLVVLVGWW